MSNLQKSLQEYLCDEGINQFAFAKICGIHHTNISSYVTFGTEPCYRHFVKMLEVMNCSADYALGLIEIDVEEKFYEPLPFGERLRAILKEKGVSQEKLKRELPVSGSVVYKWVSGKSSPYPSTLIRLAKYLDVSVDYLIGRVR